VALQDCQLETKHRPTLFLNITKNTMCDFNFFSKKRIYQETFTLHKLDKFVCCLTIHQHHLGLVPRIVEIQKIKHTKNVMYVDECKE